MKLITLNNVRVIFCLASLASMYGVNQGWAMENDKGISSNSSTSLQNEDSSDEDSYDKYPTDEELQKSFVVIPDEETKTLYSTQVNKTATSKKNHWLWGAAAAIGDAAAIRLGLSKEKQLNTINELQIVSPIVTTKPLKKVSEENHLSAASSNITANIPLIVNKQTQDVLLDKVATDSVSDEESDEESSDEESDSGNDADSERDDDGEDKENVTTLNVITKDIITDSAIDTFISSAVSTEMIDNTAHVAALMPLSNDDSIVQPPVEGTVKTTVEEALKKHGDLFSTTAVLQDPPSKRGLNTSSHLPTYTKEGEGQTFFTSATIVAVGITIAVILPHLLRKS